MSRALVLFAHPCPESYSAALHKAVVETLEVKGWEVDDCDLNAEGFEPVLSEQERRDYHDEARNTRHVQDYVARLLKADALVLVFPVWNFGFPAILKGFIDRVFLPGVSFSLHGGRFERKLLNIRKLAIVTTYGTPRYHVMWYGDPPRRMIAGTLRYVCHPRAKMRYLALYDMDRNDDAILAAHLLKVRQSMERF